MSASARDHGSQRKSSLLKVILPLLLGGAGIFGAVEFWYTAPTDLALTLQQIKIAAHKAIIESLESELEAAIGAGDEARASELRDEISQEQREFRASFAGAILQEVILPQEIRTRLEKRPSQPSSTCWSPGQTLRVGFNGGDTEVHKRIADVANEWTKHGNLHLDFGIDPETGEFRTWREWDTQYQCDIRIAFHHAGTWSMVGTDSNNPAVMGPGDASMNFAGWDRDLPRGYSASILSLFGYAFGFQRQHLNPLSGCDAEFRWSDDPDYVPKTDAYGSYVADGEGRHPGVYTIMGGPPWIWTTSKVDYQLRQRDDSSEACAVGPFDRSSIMALPFPAEWFKHGDQSDCFTTRSEVLSRGDKERFAEAYPFDDE